MIARQAARRGRGRARLRPGGGRGGGRADARSSTCGPTPYEASAGADVVALLTEWEELRWLDFERVRAAMRRPAIVDARNLLDPAAMRRRGFEYTAAMRDRRVGWPNRGHRRRRLRRLAPVRGAARARRRGGRGRQPLARAARDNVAHLARPTRASSCRRRRRATSIPVAGRVDGVLHLASPASPPEYLAMPLETLDVSSIGTRRALDLARANDAPFLLASTSEIYGDPLVHPQSETLPRQRRSDRSARGLRRGEALRRDAHDDVPPSLRPPDADRAHLQHVRPAPASGRRARRVELPGAGDRRRAAHDLRHAGRRPVRSATSTTRCAASSRCSTPTSSSRSTSATRSSSRCWSWPSSCARSPARSPSSCSSRCPSATRPGASPTSHAPSELLGWEPKIELREGLERTHAWYLEERARGRA